MCTLLKEELAEVHAHREQYRQKRRKAGIPIVALVGYTNAGKSTLLNRLTDAAVLAEDKLFATLDPTTRRIALPSGRDALLTDTVGFINHLPTQLVAAFRATLEEISEADVLIHVVDLTHPNAEEQAATVRKVLAELQVGRSRPSSRSTRWMRSAARCRKTSARRSNCRNLCAGLGDDGAGARCTARARRGGA